MRDKNARLRTAITGVIALTGALVVPAVLAAPAGAASTKTSICHATNSHTNPYRRITVAQGALAAHRQHHGSGAVWSSGITTRWDDIIPDGTGTYDGSNGVKHSWPSGKAIYDGVTRTASGAQACKGMSAKAYYDSEIAAGIPQADVLADLNSQKANEDAALLAAIGGSFTADNVGQLDAIRATTDAATPVGTTTATLRGTVVLGRDGVSPTVAEQAALSFQWGADPFLDGAATALSVPAAASGSTTALVTTTASSALTGLTAGQTYYFRIVAVTDSGLESQATLEGAIRSFMPTGSTAQALEFEAGADDVAGGPGRTYPFAATASGKPVVLTTDTPAACTVSGHSVALSGVGTCTLTASVAGDATYLPVSVTDSFLITAPVTSTDTGTGTGTAPVTDTPPVTEAAPGSGTAPVETPAVDTPAPGPVAAPADTFVTAPVTPPLAPPVTAPIDAPTGTSTPVVLSEPTRIAGPDRTHTAAVLALESYSEPGSASAVVLARDDLFADGLAGSPLAGTVDGPLLLTATARLSTPTADAIDAVLAPGGTVYVLGGPVAVSPDVVLELESSGYRVERIGGGDRFETATLIADWISRTRPIDGVFVATGLSFPDALSASSAAGLTGGVVVLTKGATMPDSTAGWLDRHQDLPTTAIGGAAAAATPGTRSVVGTDRYATAAHVAAAVAGSTDGMVLVTGADFPDGLAAASYASGRSWPMLLVDPTATALNTAQTGYLDRVRGGVRELRVVGGNVAVPEATTDLVRARLQ